jgi:hypothetical protein
MRTANAASAAFQAAFMVHGDPVAFLAVDIRRTNIKAGLALAFVFTYCAVYNLKVAFLIDFETIKE